MKNLSGLASMIPSLAVMFIAGMGLWQSIHRMKALQGYQRTLTRDTMVSGFVAGIAAVLAALAYFFWSFSRNELLLVSAIFGFAAFLVSVVWVGRLSFRWSELMFQRKKPIV